MPTNNDAQPYVENEVVIPTGAAQVSYGFSIQPQATRMGLYLTAAETGAGAFNGTYTVIVETAVNEDPASGDWVELSFCSTSFNDVGVFPIQVVQPVYDKVRVRIETDAINPNRASVSVHWMCDQPLTALDPTI